MEVDSETATTSDEYLPMSFEPLRSSYAARDALGSYSDMNPDRAPFIQSSGVPVGNKFAYYVHHQQQIQRLSVSPSNAPAHILHGSAQPSSVLSRAPSDVRDATSPIVPDVTSGYWCPTTTDAGFSSKFLAVDNSPIFLLNLIKF